MKSFDTLDELWLDAAEEIVDNGHDIPSRDGPTREILGYVARLEDPMAHFMFNPGRRLSVWYAAAEVLWYLSGEERIDRIVKYAPQYERFTESGVAWGAYGNRWSRYDQLRDLVILLRNRPDTRQAIVTMWDVSDLPHAIMGDVKDLPCTLTMNFIVRDGKLNLAVTMRSNDIWIGMPYDIFAMTCIQILIAEELGLDLGWYQHQPMSLHVYNRNRKAFDRAFGSFSTDSLSYVKQARIFERIPQALKIEEWNRKNHCCTTKSPLLDTSLLGQLTIMAALKWTDQGLNRITNPMMRRHHDVHNRRK